MKKADNNRRSFIKKVGLGGLAAVASPVGVIHVAEPAVVGKEPVEKPVAGSRPFNAWYKDAFLSRVAFPIGGLGAGMFCLEGTGAISHMSINHKPEIYNEPNMFAAISITSGKKMAKILEGPVPQWKIFGPRGTGNGSFGANYGLPRFDSASFLARFPFASIQLTDTEMPLKVEITGWSPFIPTDPDASGLPAGAIEYTFKNTTAKTVDAVFSYNSRNFVDRNEKKAGIRKLDKGYILFQEGTDKEPHFKADFAIATSEDNATVDYCWFRGGWFDPVTMIWKNIEEGKIVRNQPIESGAPGASLFVPFSLGAGQKKTIRVMMCWYVPEADLHIGDKGDENKEACCGSGCCCDPQDSGLAKVELFKGANYKPWYASRFKNVDDVAQYWAANYDTLREKSGLFRDAFYQSTLPAEVIEAVAANLTILKSPTVMRQYDGRLWCWEGCTDDSGCCHGSCTHVWNYAQAIAHLFPSLERSLRHTEFCESQNLKGHQTFRANLPISQAKHEFHAAADGQLGGIMKVYREWRISGDNEWLKKMFPMVKKSLDYCIDTWDPSGRGVVEEPHHNTYDIEFWGPDGMCTSFYLGALQAVIRMGKFLRENISKYEDLLKKGTRFLENELYNGEYFYQKIVWEGLKAKSPVEVQTFGGEYSDEAKELLKKEGPKYQYGNGCLSDGILGSWIASVCGLDDVADKTKIASHLTAVHKYNFKKSLKAHVNPQRPAFAMGNEGGLLLCSWPRGGQLSLPFVYSNEVWTGIEYQVASHLMLRGKLQQGLDIVRACRQRYDGRIRNPFNEYECGHWYARAMSSYGMLQGLTGLRYDAVEKTLYVDSRIGDFTCFISTEKGFGTATLKNKKVDVKVFVGTITIDNIKIA